MCEVMCSGVFGGDGGVVGWMLIGMGMRVFHHFLPCILFYNVGYIQCSIELKRRSEGRNESTIRIVRGHSYPLSSCFAIPFFSVSE